MLPGGSQGFQGRPCQPPAEGPPPLQAPEAFRVSIQASPGACDSGGVHTCPFRFSLSPEVWKELQAANTEEDFLTPHPA